MAAAEAAAHLGRVPHGLRFPRAERGDRLRADHAGEFGDAPRRSEGGGTLEIGFDLRAVRLHAGQRDGEFLHLLLPDAAGAQLDQAFARPRLPHPALQLVNIGADLRGAAGQGGIGFPVRARALVQLVVQVVSDHVVGDQRRPFRITRSEADDDGKAAVVMGDGERIERAGEHALIPLALRHRLAEAERGSEGLGEGQQLLRHAWRPKRGVEFRQAVEPMFADDRLHQRGRAQDLHFRPHAGQRVLRAVLADRALQVRHQPVHLHHQDRLGGVARGKLPGAEEGGGGAEDAAGQHQPARAPQGGQQLRGVEQGAKLRIRAAGMRRAGRGGMGSRQILQAELQHPGLCAAPRRRSREEGRERHPETPGSSATPLTRCDAGDGPLAITHPREARLSS